MLSSKDVAVVYETLLSSPGMNDAVKITMQVQRKNVLLLTKVIEAGLSGKDDLQNNLLATAGKDSFDELRKLSDELLARAGLTEMNEKLSSLQSKS
jgi:hypothetical protein